MKKIALITALCLTIGEAMATPVPVPYNDDEQGNSYTFWRWMGFQLVRHPTRWRINIPWKTIWPWRLLRPTETDAEYSSGKMDHTNSRW